MRWASTVAKLPKARPVGKRKRAGFISRKAISAGHARAPHPPHRRAEAGGWGRKGGGPADVAAGGGRGRGLQLEGAVEAGRVVEDLEPAGAGSVGVDAERDPQLGVREKMRAEVEMQRDMQLRPARRPRILGIREVGQVAQVQVGGWDVSVGRDAEDVDRGLTVEEV